MRPTKDGFKPKVMVKHDGQRNISTWGGRRLVARYGNNVKRDLCMQKETDTGLPKEGYVWKETFKRDLQKKGHT